MNFQLDDTVGITDIGNQNIWTLGQTEQGKLTWWFWFKVEVDDRSDKVGAY